MSYFAMLGHRCWLAVLLVICWLTEMLWGLSNVFYTGLYGPCIYVKSVSRSSLRFDSAASPRLIPAGNLRTFPTALIWILSAGHFHPVGYADWLLKERDTASMERLLHVYRLDSWPELLKQVWSNNRPSVSWLFELLWDTICCEDRML